MGGGDYGEMGYSPTPTCRAACCSRTLGLGNSVGSRTSGVRRVGCLLHEFFGSSDTLTYPLQCASYLDKGFTTGPDFVSSITLRSRY